MVLDVLSDTALAAIADQTPCPSQTQVCIGYQLQEAPQFWCCLGSGMVGECLLWVTDDGSGVGEDHRLFKGSGLRTESL